MAQNWNEVLTLSKSGNNKPLKRLEKTPEEWKKILSPEEYRVTRQHGTERPHSGEYCQAFDPGIYSCRCCGTILFDSNSKFESGTGWPSFSSPVESNVIKYVQDSSFGMVRVETLCNICDAHLGHVFPDGPAPTKLRYCMNSISLKKV